MSSIRVSATCAAISQLLDREVEDTPRMEIFSVSLTSSFLACHTGSRLVPKADSSDTAIVNSTTGPPNAISSTRGMSAWRQRHESRSAPVAERDPCRTADGREHHGFGEALAHQCCRSSPERDAHGRFVSSATICGPASGSSRSHRRSAARSRRRRGASTTRACTCPTVASSRPSRRTPYPGIGFGELGREPGSHRRELGARISDRSPVTQPRYRPVIPEEPLRRRERTIESILTPCLDAPRKVEPLGHDADHGHRGASFVDERLPDHVRGAAEAALPQAISQDDFRRIPNGSVRPLGVKRPAENRPHAQHVEEARRDFGAPYDLGLSTEAQEPLTGRREVDRDAVERLAAVAPRHVTSGGHIAHARCPEPGFVSQMRTRRSGWRYGNGLSRTAWTTAKTAALAPMPRASVSTALSAKPGERDRVRRA